jgi:hypothetical protein
VLSTAEISRGVQGSLGFLHRDPAAPLHFDNTMEACLRSFRVMALVAPIYALYVVIAYSDLTVTADDTEIALAEGVGYIVNWLLFPVLFYEIARRRGWLERYPRYIGALNWINLPATAIAVAAIAVSTFTPAAVALIIDLGLKALAFYWFLVATRMILGTNWLLSVVLLVVNWVPSVFVSYLITRYVGVVSVTAG